MFAVTSRGTVAFVDPAGYLVVFSKFIGAGATKKFPFALVDMKLASNETQILGVLNDKIYRISM